LIQPPLVGDIPPIVGMMSMPYVVMVRCPNADEAVPTGMVCDLKTFDDLPDKPAHLDCPVCGHTHEWSPSDAWLRGAAYYAAGRVPTSGLASSRERDTAYAALLAHER
jgi:hypothetical protein